VVEVEQLDGGIRISVGRASELSVSAVKRLFSLSGSEKDAGIFRWQYLQGVGPAYVAIAHDARGPIDGGVASYAAFPVPFRMGSQIGSAVQSFDTLTLPSHRGKGLFVRLARTVYEHAAESGELAVFGFPNESSVHGFVKHLGWTIEGPAPLLLRPIGWRYPRVRAKLRDSSVLPPSPLRAPGVVLPQLGSSVSDLYRQLEGDEYFGTRHTTAYLDWRLRRPLSGYSVHHSTADDGSLNAFGVTELMEKHGCAIGYILDYVEAPGAPRSGLRLMTEMVDELRGRGADLVFLWNRKAVSNRRFTVRDGFIKIPQILRPIKLNYGGVVLGVGGHRPGFPQSWAPTYLDSDTV